MRSTPFLGCPGEGVQLHLRSRAWRKQPLESSQLVRTFPQGHQGSGNRNLATTSNVKVRNLQGQVSRSSPANCTHGVPKNPVNWVNFITICEKSFRHTRGDMLEASVSALRPSSSLATSPLFEDA